MPTTTTELKEQQKRWQKIVENPLLNELPYKVETNSRGQIVLSPHSLSHADLQGIVLDLLRSHTDGGRGIPEVPICTSGGCKQIDAVWVSTGRFEEMKETGDPPTLAPEVCVEVMSDSNTWEEMKEKRALYLEAGAEEVWVVDEDGRVRFFTEEEMEHSQVIPTFPKRV